VLNIQGDQNMSVHLMITIQSSVVQRLFDHHVLTTVKTRVFGFCAWWS